VFAKQILVSSTQDLEKATNLVALVEANGDARAKAGKPTEVSSCSTLFADLRKGPHDDFAPAK
jgi:hypothetical protein